MNIKTVSQCTLEEVLRAWNKGFEGYIVPIDMTAEMFLQRLVGEGLSVEHSIVAFDDHEPIGIVMNGFRHMGGKKIAWNGGTGISPTYRGKGVSRLLMEETLAIYERENVEIATLEAIKENSVAIALYERYGYVITDHLQFLSGEYEAKIEHTSAIRTEIIRPEQLPHVPFYQEDVPWQCSWHSIKQGEARVFYNEANDVLGYMLYKTVWGKQGELERVILYQLEVLEEYKVDLLAHFLASVTAQKVNITAVNFRASNPATSYLVANGLKVTTEQVQMKSKSNHSCQPNENPVY
ncbi:GNAT family N-acetyltransferase [Lysinibacillus fusiformis]|uniref:GNAT family N-acetyltransferase n=1 Tax=Lysinibacillus fusiformis TaxID=28031 RepID=UPI0002F25541|nr:MULTISPECIES: GNAT family N-acetyltransferase [Lysinibacillus]MCG7434536.1 GNAT family N-acetyltransferase [Lysinibacillus fusiformis]MED4078452.1 GNAT family N-acetyltransferase [Lysinibacillus fusiformis]MED4671335.1 GNAT family N-acetyltransferase [Lysinibacillus fusiformis]PCD84138.1 GNAT family N-acetyltransferase [Lysinibacillus fusiformis]QAS55208.1 GNAT family N-acetyltransferase [Lysinibacillus sphaericus]